MNLKKELVCIQCPLGCNMIVEIDNMKVVSVKQNKCPKGEVYAKEEIENPKRMVTSTAKTNLKIKFLPVKSSSPVPKDKVFDFLKEIEKLEIKKSVKAGDILAENVLGLQINIIAGRTAD